LKPIGFVPGVLSGKELLETFSKQTGNIAVVTDEYGGTAGIITIEDVIEEIFGDIEDEHDKEDWLEAVKQDKLNWIQISDLKKWESTVVNTYQIQGIPFNVLLDPTGKIIATDLRGSALQNTLKQLLP
jgi:Mg2+/Co2+ transporter CorC